MCKVNQQINKKRYLAQVCWLLSFKPDENGQSGSSLLSRKKPGLLIFLKHYSSVPTKRMLCSPVAAECEHCDRS